MLPKRDGGGREANSDLMSILNKNVIRNEHWGRRNPDYADAAVAAAIVAATAVAVAAAATLSL